MIIEIAGGGYPTAGWWFILIPVAIIVIGILCMVFWGRDADWSPGVIMAGVMLTIFYALIFGAAYGLSEERQVQEVQKEKALEQPGFENVDVDGNSFTASRDGDYFSGSLLEIGGNTYQVVEKVEVK